MRPIHRIRSILIALFALVTLCGLPACGQKGPLKLPPDAPKITAQGVAK